MVAGLGVSGLHVSHTASLLHLICLLSGVFRRHNEAYTWTNPTCCVHNVIIGKLWIEQYGTVEILNHR